jgi:hypothetical protein
MLTTEFLAGYISANGSFMNIKVRDKRYPVFQIKCSISNYPLLLKITHSLGATNVVHKYKHNNQQYCLLLIRDRETLLNKIISILDGHLDGQKRDEFENWKKEILNNSSTWNFRVHKNSANSYFISDTEKNLIKT